MITVLVDQFLMWMPIAQIRDFDPEGQFLT